MITVSSNYDDDEMASVSADQAESRQLQDVPLLVQYLQLVRKNRLWIATILIASLIIGAVLTLLATPYYTSSTRLEISRSQDQVTNVEGLQAEDIGQNVEFYQTQYALLEARSIAARVVRKLNLVSDTAFFESFGVSPDGGGIFVDGEKQNLRAADRARRMRLATSILLDNVEIAPIRGSSLIDVEFQSPDPEFSAKIANAWVEQFIESSLDRKFDATADARKFLEERLTQLRQRLEESERQLVGYASNKQIVVLSNDTDSNGKSSGGRTLISDDLEALNAELARATAARVIAQAEANARNGENRAAQSNPAISSLRQKRAEVESERAKLLTQFEPEYPTVEALTSQISSLDAAISREERRTRSSIGNNFQEALQRERQLQARVNQLKDSLIGQRRDTIQYNIYQREVDTNRQLYDGLLQRFKEIGVAGISSSNIIVVDQAEVPTQPSSPILLLNLGLATLVGLSISGLFVFAREQIDQTIKDPAESKNHFNLPALGGIPNFENGDAEILEQLEDRKSVVSESYLTFTTNLSFLTHHGVPRSLLLTSSQPNEGKSTSAFAIARLLSRTDKRVLLVDADLRNASLHMLVAQENEEGLSNFLTGNSEIESVIRPSAHKGLDFIFAGPKPPNAAELFSNNRLQQLLSSLEQKYDIVILDGPPMLSIADGPLIAQTVEGVIYTIEANSTKIRAVQAGLNRLDTANCTVFGTLITKLDAGDDSYGYYGYGYGNDAD